MFKPTGELRYGNETRHNPVDGKSRLSKPSAPMSCLEPPLSPVIDWQRY